MSLMSGEKSTGEKLRLVISDEKVREVEIDDRDDDDGEPYASPPQRGVPPNT
jgi:hypothetical protein